MPLAPQPGRKSSLRRPLQTPPSPSDSPLPPPPPRKSSRSGAGRQPSRQHQDQHQRQHQRQHQQHQQHQHKHHEQTRPQKQQAAAARNLSDDYLLSKEDDDLYEARMAYLRRRRASQSKEHRVLPPLLLNYANSGQRKGHKTILTYDQATQSPTADLKTLVLLLFRAQIRDEVLHLSDILNDQNPFEMRQMRLNSFIAGTPDLIDYWKVAMLEEGMRITEKSIDDGSVAWVTAKAGANCSLPVPMDERILVSLPADKPEISKSQVATEYIQAQRGQQGYEQDDTTQLFQSEVLKAENAAEASQDIFDRVCVCYKSVVQKAVEIEYIEKRPETCQAVDNYVEMLKGSMERVVQESLTQCLMDASKQGDAFFRTLVGDTMAELHDSHKGRSFEPMRVVVSSHRKD